jgi:hypothetical protein
MLQRCYCHLAVSGAQDLATRIPSTIHAIWVTAASARLFLSSDPVQVERRTR